MITYSTYDQHRWYTLRNISGKEAVRKRKKEQKGGREEVSETGRRKRERKREREREREKTGPEKREI